MAQVLKLKLFGSSYLVLNCLAQLAVVWLKCLAQLVAQVFGSNWWFKCLAQVKLKLFDSSYLPLVFGSIGSSCWLKFLTVFGSCWPKLFVKSMIMIQASFSW